MSNGNELDIYEKPCHTHQYVFNVCKIEHTFSITFSSFLTTHVLRLESELIEFKMAENYPFPTDTVSHSQKECNPNW